MTWSVMTTTAIVLALALLLTLDVAVSAEAQVACSGGCIEGQIVYTATLTQVKKMVANADGTYTTTTCMGGFLQIYDIESDDEGNIYVADRNLVGVYRVEADCSSKKKIISGYQPWDLAYDQTTNHLYVANYGGYSYVWDYTLNAAGDVTNTREVTNINAPQSLRAYNGVAVYDGYLYIVHNKYDILKVSLDGTTPGTKWLSAQASGITDTMGVHVSEFGVLFLSANDNNRIVSCTDVTDSSSCFWYCDVSTGGFESTCDGVWNPRHMSTDCEGKVFVQNDGGLSDVVVYDADGNALTSTFARGVNSGITVTKSAECDFLTVECDLNDNLGGGCDAGGSCIDQGCNSRGYANSNCACECIANSCHDGSSPTGSHCECPCDSGSVFEFNSDTQDCDVCPLDSPIDSDFHDGFCNGLGWIKSDCETCNCDAAACPEGQNSGDESNSDDNCLCQCSSQRTCTNGHQVGCGCECDAGWKKVNPTDDACLVCDVEDDFCGDRGYIGSDCRTCVCDDCSHDGSTPLSERRCFFNTATFQDESAAKMEYETVNEGTADEQIHITLTMNRNFYDNTYGDNIASYWRTGPGKSKGHSWGDLVESDKADMALYDKTGEVVMSFEVDLVSRINTVNNIWKHDTACVTPGYGGEGQMYTCNGAKDHNGLPCSPNYSVDPSNVVNCETSTGRNMYLPCTEAGCGVDLTESSPPTTNDYDPPACCPDWEFDVIFDVWVKSAPFSGGGGYWKTAITLIHASPSMQALNKIEVFESLCPGDENTCECICPSPFVTDATSGDCTCPPERLVDSNNNGLVDYCNDAGVLNDDCECDCTAPCDNGSPHVNSLCVCGTSCPNTGDCAQGTPDIDNSCQCVCDETYITTDGEGKCTLCDRPSNYCSDRGFVPTSVGDTECACECIKNCANGFPADSACNCECEEPFTGDECDECIPGRTRVDWCNSRGEIRADCETCNCDESSSWGGQRCDSCTKICSVGTLNVASCECECVDCENSGTLNEATCDCACPAPWTGELCGTCPDLGCKKPGQQRDSDCTCVCDEPELWAGPKCKICQKSQADCKGREVFNGATCACDCPGNLGCAFGSRNAATCECDCIGDQWGGSKCDICQRTDDYCDGRGEINLGCECDCAAKWKNGGSGDVDDCSWCPEYNPFDSVKWCKGGPSNGLKDDCDTCDCQEKCKNGTPVGDCECECDDNWALNPFSGECDICTKDVDQECSGRANGFDEKCDKCECIDCANGGTLNENDCSCTCPSWFPKSASGDCGVCTRDNVYCRNNGQINNDCRTCKCEKDKCSNGGTYQNDGRCGCDCDDVIWTNNNVNTDCTVCLRDNSYCNNRGILDVADCETCKCTKDACKNGEIKDGRCNCKCDGAWEKDLTGVCSVCTNTNEELCNSRGVVSQETCDTCNCIGCSNGGTSKPNCKCDCDDEIWARGDDNDCTVCLRTDADHCNGRGVVQADCDKCLCTEKCSNGGTTTESCGCDCDASDFDYDPETGDCTKCPLRTSGTADPHCNDRGYVASDCNSCVCPPCANGGINDGSCMCSCPQPWGVSTLTNDCDRCIPYEDDTLCWGGNRVDPKKCEECVCENKKCGTGKFQQPDCSCGNCEYPYSEDTAGDCTVCAHTSDSLCSGNGDVVSCSGCLCTSPCSNGGLQDHTDCSCDCASSNFFADLVTADCTVCVLTDNDCEGLSVVDIVGTCTCKCLDCQNGVSNDSDCSCDCEDNWATDLAGDCTVCTLSGADHCSGRGTVADDCDTCVCQETECKNGGVQQPDCSCMCEGVWAEDTSGDCTVCTIEDSVCANGGVSDREDCSGCKCPDCLNGGISDEFCNCVCETPYQIGSDGLCSECIRGDDACSRGGYLKDDCNGCVCPACPHGQLVVNSYGFWDCSCECRAPFAADGQGTCEKCVLEGCERGGELNLVNDCKTCDCPLCSNDAEVKDNCKCKCNSKRWGHDATGDCTVCKLTNEEHCSDRGVVDADCQGCICLGCVNGKEKNDCSCDCSSSNFDKDDDGACTVCARKCEDDNERLDETTCECVTCPNNCDDRNECTEDTCVDGVCINELLQECAKCLNMTSCGSCNDRDECEWVNCDDNGLVFSNASIIRLDDVERLAVDAEVAAQRVKLCEKAKKKNDVEGTLEYCVGERDKKCQEAIKNDDIKEIFTICDLATTCDQAEFTGDVFFMKRFCVPDADGTLNQAGVDLTDDDEEVRARATREVYEEYRGGDIAREVMANKSKKIKKNDDVEINIDGTTMTVKEVAKLILDDSDRCIPIKLNNTLRCSDQGCSSTDNAITATSLSIGAATGGGAAAGGAVGLFGLTAAAAVYRTNSGVPGEIPDCNFDATDAFANVNDALYDDMADGMVNSNIWVDME